LIRAQAKDEMKTANTILLLALLLVGCRNIHRNCATEEITYVERNWFDTGTLVLAHETNATDVLVLTIDVDNLIRDNKTEWPYRRLTERERVNLGGHMLCINADGGRGGYGLSLSPMQTVIGTNIEFTIRFYGSQDGNRRDGKETILVPVTGTSTGKVGYLTYRSEWRPNQVPEDTTRKLADPQH